MQKFFVFVVIGVLAAFAVAGGVRFAAPTDSAAAVRFEAGGVAAPPLPLQVPKASFDPSSSLADLDASVLVTARAETLSFNDGVAGALLRTSPLLPGTELRAVSADGSLAATYQPLPGASLITVVPASAESSTRSYRFEGTVEPEAFATDGSILYVIDHQAASTPGAYRVRPLDLATGDLGVMLGPQKLPIPEEMNGSARRQIWAPMGDRLYTLYIRQTVHVHDDGDSHSHGQPGTDGFVHVLDLAEEWAFCLHLPNGFGLGELADTAIAVDPVGRELAILDLHAGQLAWASTDDLQVTSVLDFDPALGSVGDVHLAVTDSHVAVGRGSAVSWFDRQTLDPAGEPAELGHEVLGLVGRPTSVTSWTGIGKDLDPPSG